METPNPTHQAKPEHAEQSHRDLPVHLSPVGARLLNLRPDDPIEDHAEVALFDHHLANVSAARTVLRIWSDRENPQVTVDEYRETVAGGELDPELAAILTKCADGIQRKIEMLARCDVFLANGGEPHRCGFGAASTSPCTALARYRFTNAPALGVCEDHMKWFTSSKDEAEQQKARLRVTLI